MVVSSRLNMEGKIMNKQKHLNLESRSIIELELSKGTSFKAIALLLGKDCTTISKEIRAHRVYEKVGAYSKAFNDCKHAFFHQCQHKHICNLCYSPKRPCWSCAKCLEHCISYVKYSCPKIKKPPYVCNGCSERRNCCLEKSFYRASKAQQEYETLKSESRSGIALSEGELKHLDNVISPLIKQGQSLHHISIYHENEIMTSERTLYKYINLGLFSARNIDMPRVVRMRPRKKRATALKVDKSCRINRTYDDYQTYIQEHPDTPVCQLDSVEGVRGGAVLLTIHLVNQELQLAFLRKSNDSQSVIDVFEKLYKELESFKPDTFTNIFPILLADNGSEFSNPKAIEFDKDGNQRTHMFYCNPNAPYQKANCENNHEMIRRIVPKGVEWGQFTQEQINLMMSHINSYARKSLGNKSPYEVFQFLYGKELLDKFNLRFVPADEIILTPELLKK